MALLSTLSRCAAIGVGTGIRSSGPLALVALGASRARLSVPSLPPFMALRDRRVAALCGAMAIGEALADATLPLPPRTWPPVLLARMGMGGLLGALVCADEAQPVALGAGVGALAAGWGAFAATGGRQWLTESGVPDLAASLIEDAQTILLGAAALGPAASAVG